MGRTLRNVDVWVFAQNVATLAALVLGPVVPGHPWHWSGPVLGVVLVLIGAAFGLAGVRALGRNRTPHPKPIEGAQLVTSGVYSLVRHPLYTSLMALALGWSLLWSSWPALAAALGLTGLLEAKARLEERWLRETFPDYPAYACRVRRFVPWLF